MATLRVFLRTFARWARSVLQRASRPFLEILIIVTVGFVPFGANIVRTSQDKNEDLWRFTLDSLSHGQLYLYSFSLFGTLVWLSFFNDRLPNFPARTAIRLVVLLSGIFMSVIGGVDPSFSNILNTTVINMSFTIYIVFLVCYFALLFSLEPRPETVGEIIEQGADDLGDEFNRVAGGVQ